MIITILMLAAAVNFVTIACFINASGFFHVTVYQLMPMVLAIGLSIFAVARIMGWPI